MNSINLFTQRPNPEAYAQQYAQQNGISIESARETLKSQYGEPQPPVNQDMSIFCREPERNSLAPNFDLSDFDFSELNFEDEDKKPNFLQNLLNLLRGGNQEEEIPEDVIDYLDYKENGPIFK